MLIRAVSYVLSSCCKSEVTFLITIIIVAKCLLSLRFITHLLRLYCIMLRTISDAHRVLSVCFKITLSVSNFSSPIVLQYYNRPRGVRHVHCRRDFSDETGVIFYGIIYYRLILYRRLKFLLLVTSNVFDMSYLFLFESLYKRMQFFSRGSN